METPIERLRRAPPLVTEPLEAHLPNNDSDNQARPLRNMPLFARTRFGRIQQGRSAFVGHEENVAEPDTTLTSTSNEDCEQTQGIQQKKQCLFVGDVELTLRGYRNFFSNEPPPCRFSAATPSPVCRRQLA